MMQMAVHRLLGPGGAAVSLVAGEFGLQPDAAGAIDRAALGKKVFQDPPTRRRLEAILHPLVSADRDSFLARHRRRARFVVLDVPLLFETGGDAFCDFVICVWAPLRVQKTRPVPPGDECGKAGRHHAGTDAAGDKKKTGGSGPAHGAWLC